MNANHPDCPYRTENYCGWLSARVGRLYHVSPVWCNAVCAKNGPYCGRAITKEQELNFLHASWWRLPPIHHPDFVRGVIKRYRKPYDIYFPPEYPAIREALQEMWGLKGFRGILLTGSMLAKNAPRPLKDYDVILWFNDVASALAAKKAYTPPVQVNGTKMDYFYLIGEGTSPDVYFASFNPENRTLYTSRWFEMNITSVSDGIIIERQNYDGLDKILEQMPEWLTADRISQPCRGKERPLLSVIITVLNDQEELLETIKSIRATSPKCEVEVIVIDDASDEPVKVPTGVRIARNDHRKGCGASRHIGVGLAKAEYVLLTDSHMRFTPGWYDAATGHFLNSPTTLYCAVCLGLGYGNMDVTKPAGAYHGAEFVLWDEKKNQTFEAVWAAPKEGDCYEIPCVMGACYFIAKEFFMRIGGLESNWLWGADEQILSLKAWLAGGDVKLMKNVRIGHKFRDEAPYRTNMACVAYNKLRTVMVVCPEQYDAVARKLRSTAGYLRAKEMIKRDMADIAAERESFKKVAVRDFAWFCYKFGITPIPAEESRELNVSIGSWSVTA